MAITVTPRYRIEIQSDGIIFLETVNTFASDDGMVIPDSLPHRAPYCPGDDVSAAPVPVQTAAAAFWTPEVVAAYQARPIPRP